MQLKLIAAAAAALFAVNAMAADPTASLNRTWTEHTGTGPVGNNNINNNDNAYWMFESAGTWMGQAVNSWFVFWDPKHGKQLKGTVSFDNNILYVHDSKAELQATSAFGKPGMTYDYSRKLVGLESADASNTTWAANTLTLKWRASNPGDHIRVMTAVPEPGTYAMFAAGLLALGFMARRRRAD
jgi:hypothetical protein